MSTIWEEVKNHIKDELPENSFSLWINPITCLDEKDDAIVLGCPNRFSLKWIKENYMGIMEEKLEKTGNGNNKISLKVKPPEKNAIIPDLFKESRQLTIPKIPVKRGNGRRRFNKEFTFDRFVVGDCNEFAYSASKALAMGGSWPYDSLFMWASTGLGKSHLSQSIGQAILDHNPNIRAYYITAEDFVNEMIFALKNKRIEEFKNRYRHSCDVLLLEEVHFLSGKEKMQQELGYTLEVLANDNKKIIFTSSLLPKDIPAMTKELSSRLTAGIITTLEKPDYKTRVRIIEKKASEQRLCLSEDIIHFFAKHLNRDVRQIESALKCLRAKSELLKAKIDLDMAKEVIKSHVSDQSQITVESIKKVICRYFKVEPMMLRSKSRKKIHSYPRNVYAYLCRRYTEATLEDIGRSIDRNHSTVLYSTEVIERKLKIDNRIKNQVEFLSENLKGMIH
jgi:chromosomal replication initiator protein